MGGVAYSLQTALLGPLGIEDDLRNIQPLTKINVAPGAELAAAKANHRVGTAEEYYVPCLRLP